MGRERLQELQKTIHAFETQRSKLADDAKNLEAKRDEHARKVEFLKRQHFEACRAEALGQPSEREKLEREISAASAKVIGTDTLISEKHEARKKLEDEHAPLQEELQTLIAAEKRDQSLADLEHLFKKGKEEIKQMIALEMSHSRRINALRSQYDGDSFVRSAAFRYAELLANARTGVRMQETFTSAEMRELNDSQRASQ